mgnify:CR=1 FL=1
MKNRLSERQIDFLRIRKYNRIIRVYQKRLIHYGKHIELFIYEKPKIILSRVGETHTRRFRKDAKRSESSALRAKRSLLRLVEANVGQYGDSKPVFATLTQKENQVSLPISNRRFSEFIKRLNYELGMKLKYVAVPEFQKRGSVHFHIVFFNLPFLHVKKFEKIWGYGMTNVQLMKKANRTGAYLAKYFTKAVQDPRLYQKKAYFSSRGLKKPVDIFGGYEVDEFLRGVTIKEVHHKNYNGLIYKKYVNATQQRPLSISRRKIF